MTNREQIKAVSFEEQTKAAIAHYRYGVDHQIFSEPVLTYAKLSINALKKTLNDVSKESEQGRCKYYHEKQVPFYPTDFDRGVAFAKGVNLPKTIMVGECWGQKNTPQCNCGGDKSKCETGR